MNKKILHTSGFNKSFGKRVAKNKVLRERFKQAVRYFLEDRNSKEIKDHALQGKMSNFRAFSVDYDCRVIYLEKESHFLFIDIGSHKEVYDE